MENINQPTTSSDSSSKRPYSDDEDTFKTVQNFLKRRKLSKDPTRPRLTSTTVRGTGTNFDVDTTLSHERLELYQELCKRGDLVIGRARSAIPGTLQSKTFLTQLKELLAVIGILAVIKDEQIPSQVREQPSPSHKAESFHVVFGRHALDILKYCKSPIHSPFLCQRKKLTFGS
jgi:hypothetical protein